MKRAQRFRLEDQRGTEINFELPDFLKDNSNKWKTLNSSSNETMTLADINESETQKKPPGKAPQPAPRLSINRYNSQNNCVDANGYPEAIIENGDRNHGSYNSFSQGTTSSNNLSKCFN